MHPAVRTTLLAAAAALLAVALTACAAAGPTWVDENASYTPESALALSQKLDAGTLAGKSTSEASTLRHDALVALRREGAGAAEAAGLITRTFPSNTTAVPIYVERATYDSKPALVIVEAVGPKDGKLTDKRVWVIGSDGEVLLAGTR